MRLLGKLVLAVVLALAAERIAPPTQMSELATAPLEQHPSQPSLCIDLSAGEITYREPTSLYRWTDADGSLHLSDQPPPQDSGMARVQVGTAEPEYFDFSISAKGAALDIEFHSQLQLRAEKAFELVASMLPPQMLNKVQLSLDIFDDGSEYREFALQQGVITNDSSMLAVPPGFYQLQQNRAVVLRQLSDQATLRIALHETVHVINAGLFGLMPRWLNEGLAEYIEYMRLYGQTTEVPWQSDWSDLLQGMQPDLTTLLADQPENWRGQSAAQMYAWSRAFVFFLLDNPEREAMLLQYFSAKAQNRCEQMEVASFLLFEGQDLLGLQLDFQTWLRQSHDFRAPHLF